MSMRHTNEVNLAVGVTTLREEEDVTRPSEPQVAIGPTVVVMLKAEVGGLHHVGNPGVAKDGAEVMMYESMGKLETHRIRVPATKQCMIHIHAHQGTTAGNMLSHEETAACSFDNTRVRNDNHQGFNVSRRLG